MTDIILGLIFGCIAVIVFLQYMQVQYWKNLVAWKDKVRKSQISFWMKYSCECIDALIETGECPFDSYRFYMNKWNDVEGWIEKDDIKVRLDPVYLMVDLNFTLTKAIKELLNRQRQNDDKKWKS